MRSANDAGSHNSMQGIVCTSCCTKACAVRACCTVCHTHAQCCCEAMAKRVMGEADLWNGDSLSRVILFSVPSLYQSPDR